LQLFWSTAVPRARVTISARRWRRANSVTCVCRRGRVSDRAPHARRAAGSKRLPRPAEKHDPIRDTRGLIRAAAFLLWADSAAVVGVRFIHLCDGAGDVPGYKPLPAPRSVPRRAHAAPGVAALLSLLAVVLRSHGDPAMGRRSSPAPCVPGPGRRPAQPRGVRPEARHMARLRALRRRRA